MAERTPKAIEMKGIVRNATKIGVQDGQAEDLINLRFMDGSWRTSGDGRHVYSMTENAGSTAAEKTYTQLFIHTNVYRHLLGVRTVDGVDKLFWFASIDMDGVTFRPLKLGNSSSEDTFIKTLPDAPVELTTVHGDLWITQTGHLLTVIDEADDFEHFVFKTSTKEYIEFSMDVNGKSTDRSLYPFGQVHFNLYEPQAAGCPNLNNDRHFVYKTFNAEHVVDTVVSNVTVALAEATKKNLFTKPFLAVVAAKLYDGSYAYASNPVLLWPRQMTNDGQSFYDAEEERLRTDSNYQQLSIEDNITSLPTVQYIVNNTTYTTADRRYLRGIGVEVDTTPKLKEYSAIYGDDGPREEPYLSLIGLPSQESEKLTSPKYASTLLCMSSNDGTSSQQYPATTHIIVQGADLLLNLSNYDCIDGDIIKSICVFITNPAEVFRYDLHAYAIKNAAEFINWIDPVRYGILVYARRTNAAITRDLINSPFYLLKEYTSQELSYLKDNPTIDLTDIKYENILTSEILVQQKKLDTEAFPRTTYLPKVSYMYNGRLHIADYKSHPFFGYPIDLFHLHNHSVKVQDGAWFKDVLPNLADNNDAYLQYTKAQKEITNYDDLVRRGAPFFLVKVYIDDTAQGEQIVCRYIPAYNPSEAPEHTANFIEDLNPLLTYPDARAKKMEIFYVDNYTTEDWDDGNYTYLACAWVKKGEFALKPHPYLNIAYYIDPNLKPIKLSAFTSEVETDNVEATIKSKTIDELIALANMQNTEEYFPNGLKVSKTDQPMFFPVENTYQVGSAEILALCSNAIAVGTGQTGAAPLYVFCTDGVYALFVDASGQMTYTNARVIARDVCNNPRSVTPTDLGVVFTTDRGLMMIAGEQVQEIGAPAEGDVVQFWNAGSVDYSKIAKASMQQIAGLPSELCSTTDFLTYLQDKGTSGKAAIINYNHNMRELMVSNPNYPYSYVLDREGNWSRRDYTAAQYVNNYPTSYRVEADGHFYKVDDEGDANTSLEHRKEADNKIFYLSNVIKLDSIGFKQAYRFVVRGYFETMDNENIACVVEGSYDGRKFKPLGYNRKAGKFRDIGCIVERTDVRFFRVCLSGQVTGKTRIDYMEMSAGASMLNTKIR